MAEYIEIKAAAPEIPSLEYAPVNRSAVGRAKKIFEVLFTTVLILSNLYFAVTKWGGWARLQTRMLICQWQCTHYAERPNRVIFDNDPSRAAILMKQVSYGPATAAQLFNQSPPSAVYLGTGETFQAFADAYNAIEQQQSPAWHFTSGILDLSANDGWMLFMHELRSASGDKRLVIIRVNLDNGDRELLMALSIEPASLTGMPKMRHLGEFESLPIFPRGGAHQRLRLFAGQLDPANASRFTMVYETPGGRGAMEGILGEEGAVALKILDGPLAPAASKSAEATPRP